MHSIRGGAGLNANPRHTLCAWILRGSVFLLFLWAGEAPAQLSPGELSDAHANLEGLTHCTACHTIGKTLSREKCLACHTDLRERVERGRGSHARYGGRTCVECHKEHHGRSFSIVHFDTEAFNH
jgi:hypothetical protein